MSKQDSKIVNLTGLWLNDGKNGKKFMSGSLGGARLLIFKNEKKREGSKDPDYFACIAPNDTKAKSKPKSENEF